MVCITAPQCPKCSNKSLHMLPWLLGTDFAEQHRSC